MKKMRCVDDFFIFLVFHRLLPLPPPAKRKNKAVETCVQQGSILRGLTPSA